MSMLEFHRVISGFAEHRATLVRYAGSAQVDKLASLVERRRGDTKPVIMVYGVYNAGKSTLINALLGAEAASVADRPETDRVTPYAWGGFTLLDTPGIDAPKAHEAVTEDQLGAADVVIFVLSSHGVVEERRTFEVIVELIRRQRRVMVVVNNKTMLLPDSVEMLALKDKIRANLQALAREAGLPDLLASVPIELVHANSALKGRLEGKATLLQRSGIERLEHKLLAFLGDSEAHDIVRTLASEIGIVVDAALAGATGVAAQSGGEMLDRVQARIERERQLLETGLQAKVRVAARDMRSEVRTLLEGARDQGSIEAGHAQISERYGERMQAFVDAALTAFASRLGTISAELELGDVAAVSIHPDAELRAVGEGEAAGPRLRMPALGGVLGKSLQQIGKKDIVSALKLGKQTFPGLFKGVGKAGMDKMANGAMKALGKKVGGKFGFPIVEGLLTIGMSMRDYYVAGQKAQRELDERRRIAQAVEDGAVQFADAFTEHADEAVAACLGQAFEPILEQIAQMRSELAADARAVGADAAMLRAFRRVLDDELAPPSIV